MGALADLWKSERGLVVLGLIIAATVLTGIGSMTVAMWQDFTMKLFVAYATAKTVTGAVQIIKGSMVAPASSDPPPASDAPTA